MEAAYYGKPVIGFPIADDQVGSCYRIEVMGIGISLRSNPSLKFVTESIDAIASDSDTNSYQSNVNRVQKIIEFKELRGGKDLAYFLRRAVKFGEFGGDHPAHVSSHHLYERSIIENSFVTVYDYDFKLMMVCYITAFAVLLYKLLKK